MQNILDGDLWPKFHMCEELITIVLFYESAHRKVIKSSDFWVLRPCVWWQTQVKLTDLRAFWTGQLSKFVIKMLWNKLKVIQFIAVANTNYIYINKGEI